MRFAPMLASAMIAWCNIAHAQSAADRAGPPDSLLSTVVDPDADGAPARETDLMSDPRADAGGERDVDRPRPFFPIWGEKARARGYRIPPALGMSAMLIHNAQDMNSRNLAIAIAKGEGPPEGASLIETPFVATNTLRSDTANTEFKADLWVFPFLNLFAGVGKVKGHVDIVVDIDLDAFIPFPFCRPADPCGTVELPFTADVDNTSFTLGAIVGVGGRDWFAAASIARTTTAPNEKERSQITTTDIALRAGPRLPLGRRATLSPYVGVNYFDFDAQVQGLVRSGPVFDDGDSVGLRYAIELSSTQPWAVVNGVNLEISRHFTVQAEYNWGAGSDRFILSATVRP